MTKVTETDLTELKALIVQSQREIEKQIETGQKENEKRFGKIETDLNGIDKKIDGLSTRLGILESKTFQQINWFLGIITLLVSGVLTFLFRSLPPA
jgi:hypothetical protein